VKSLFTKMKILRKSSTNLIFANSEFWQAQNLAESNFWRTQNLSKSKFWQTQNLAKSKFWQTFHQGILKGEVSVYFWPPVWLVWNQRYDNQQVLFLFAKQTNPNQSNRRSMVQWYFPFSIPCFHPLLFFFHSCHFEMPVRRDSFKSAKNKTKEISRIKKYFLKMF
jgi:hypothetical protein